MRTKEELYEQGFIYYADAVDELLFEAEDMCLFNKYGFEYLPLGNEAEHVVDNGNRVKISFKAAIEGFDEDIILEASCIPYEIDNISYVIKCGSFHSQVQIPVTDLSKLEEYVARCVYVYEEKNKQYKEMCQKALESLSKPTKSVSKYLANNLPLVSNVFPDKAGMTFEEMGNIKHTLGQYEE